MPSKFEIVSTLIKAWSRGRIEEALVHLDDDLVWHYAAGFAPPTRNKAQAEKLMRRMAAEHRDVNWKIFDYAERGDRLFVEGADCYVSAGGQAVTAPYAGVFEFRGELICGWRDYLDVSIVTAQEGGAAPSAWVAALADRPDAA
jgi:limonene-1,2-epoxide hydrolase